jgi:hypothetical protein
MILIGIEDKTITFGERRNDVIKVKQHWLFDGTLVEFLGHYSDTLERFIAQEGNTQSSFIVFLCQDLGDLTQQQITELTNSKLVCRLFDPKETVK